MGCCFLGAYEAYRAYGSYYLYQLYIENQGCERGNRCTGTTLAVT